MDEKEKKQKRAKAVSEGIISEQYTLNGYFVKVKPVFSADPTDTFAYNWPSVVFSFVEKGKKGSGFDVYVDIDVFDNWADDVLSRRFLQVIEAEKAAGEKYPKTYKYVTGTNGEKSVGFCAGMKTPFVINGTTKKDDKTVFASVPVDYDWLRITMKWYKRISTAWFDAMAVETLKNANKIRSSYAKDASYDEADTPATPVAIETEAVAAPKASEASKPVEKPIEVDLSGTQPYEVKTTTLIKEFGKGKDFCFQAYTKENKKISVVILKKDIPGISHWDAFNNKVSNETGVMVKFKGLEYKDRVCLKALGH